MTLVERLNHALSDLRKLRLGHRYTYIEITVCDTIEALEAAEAERRRLEGLVYAPGLWRCAKCNFQLAQANLNAQDGSVTARDQPGDKCPNCGSPLWRMTERDAGNEMVRRAEEYLVRAAKAEAENARLREALSLIRHNWAGHSEACAVVRGERCDCDWPKVAAECEAALSPTKEADNADD